MLLRAHGKLLASREHRSAVRAQEMSSSYFPHEGSAYPGFRRQCQPYLCSCRGSTAAWQLPLCSTQELSPGSHCPGLQGASSSASKRSMSQPWGLCAAAASRHPAPGGFTRAAGHTPWRGPLLGSSNGSGSLSRRTLAAAAARQAAGSGSAPAKATPGQRSDPVGSSGQQWAGCTALPPCLPRATRAWELQWQDHTQTVAGSSCQTHL